MLLLYKHSQSAGSGFCPYLQRETSDNATSIQDLVYLTADILHMNNSM